jgi:hypothetical protein
MQLLEKLEKNEVLQNKKMIENISLNNIFTNISKIFDKNTYKDVILNNRNL